jgi:hypothetical protein
MPTPEDLKQEAAEKEREAEERDEKAQQADEKVEDLRSKGDRTMRNQPTEQDEPDAAGDGNKFSSS